MAKQLAPVPLTGGAGFNFEDHVAGRFLVDMLAGISSFGPNFGQVIRLDWQVRDSGRLLDDLMIELDGPDRRRTAELSIKSNRQVTSAGFPSNFVEAAWEQFLNLSTPTFRRDRDLVVLVVGEIAHDVFEAWNKLLRESLSTSADRMASRLEDPSDPDKGSQSSATERALVASMHRPDKFLGQGDTDSTETIGLIRRTRVLHFDFCSEPSRCQAALLADCRRLIKAGTPEQAANLWARILRIAADKRANGGTIDLAALLAELRDSFELLDHPDFRTDWQALERISRGLLDDVSIDIGGKASLDRCDDVDRVASTLSKSKMCIVAGESGSGKSALAKMLGEARYGLTVFLSSDFFDSGRQPELEELLKISRPLTDVLSAARDTCLLVVDAMERCSEGGLRLVGRLLQVLLANANCDHVHVLLVTQADVAYRIVQRLGEAGVNGVHLSTINVGLPAENSIRELWHTLHGVGWATLHHDMRPLLRNLKILDWVVRFAGTTESWKPGTVTGLIPLVNHLWSRWVESDRNDVARGGLLKKLATLEASQLTAGVSLTHLDHAELTALTSLIEAGLLRRRQEHIYFSHDLLGDWARLKVLIGGDPTDSPASLHRYAVAHWHRAVRLFGRWLLSKDNGVQEWSDAIARASNGTDEGIVIRDLLLDSVILSENSGQLFALTWSMLAESGGHLLQRLLDRFLFIASIPDARAAALQPGEPMSPQVEAAFRVPFGPYWGAVLTILAEKSGDVSVKAPIEGARICRMWLEHTPPEVVRGKPFPWRAFAARAALAIAREVQATRAEGHWRSDQEDDIAYEAALLSAFEFPDDVATFALEMAERRPARADIQHRAEVTRRQSEERHKEWLAENAEHLERIKRASSQSISRGSRLKPWPDGPSDRVQSPFQDAVLKAAIVPLAQMRPEAALEVLLAVCIQAPGFDGAYGSSDRAKDYGVVSWNRACPPLYFRGPFLQLLRACPDVGIEFSLRLINFATQRWRIQEERWRSRRENQEFIDDRDSLDISVPFPEATKTWIGDSRVFRWHLDWSVDSHVIPCVLMALEKWLYEQLDAGHDLTHSLRTVMQRSESVAFAGMLIDVGKREPSYFLSALRPLLGVSSLYLWDFQIVLSRSRSAVGLIAWWNQSQELVALARQWHLAEHRAHLLSQIIVGLMLSSEDLNGFLVERRERWCDELKAAGDALRLKILIAQLDRSNYKETQVDDGVLVEFSPPQPLAERLRETQHQADASIQLLTFPTTCRSTLDGEQPLPLEDVPMFWQTIMSIASAVEEEDDDFRSRQSDATLGGIAVLIRWHRKWLSEEQGRIEWCLEQMVHVMHNPPPRREFDCPEAIGNSNWECFIAEAATCLMAEDPSVEFVREVVAMGITAFHFNTTRATARLAHELRDVLGQDYRHIQHLIVHWSVVRPLWQMSDRYLAEAKRWHTHDLDIDGEPPSIESLSAEAEKWRRRHVELVDGFVNGEVEPLTLQEAAKLGFQESERLDSVRYPGRDSINPRRRRTRGRSPRKRRRSDIGLDTRVVEAGFSWMDLSTAKSRDERQNILGYVRDLLNIVVESVQAQAEPETAVDEDDEIDGLPTEFDGWVFSHVARAIVQARPDERPATFWEPILGLGRHAHQWVGRFFWDWFTDGVQVARTPEHFASHWIEMIRHAIADREWDSSGAGGRYVGEMAWELLGYHFGMTSIAANDKYTPILEGMADLLDQAAARWCSNPQVLNGLARSLQEPAYDRILCRGIVWLRRAIIDADDYGLWQQSHIESHLISALDRCWTRYGDVVAADPTVKAAFLGLVTILASRGGHAAMALRERLLKSLSGSEWR